MLGARADFNRAVRWQRDHPGLSERHWSAELEEFQAEAKAALNDLGAELPNDLFAPPVGSHRLEPTSLSLIDRLRWLAPRTTTGSGSRASTCRSSSGGFGAVPGLAAEADDLAQEVFVVVIRELARFERRA